MSAEERIEITAGGSTIKECRQRAKAALDALCDGEAWRWSDVLYVPLVHRGDGVVIEWEGHFTAWIIDEDAIEAT